MEFVGYVVFWIVIDQLLERAGMKQRLKTATMRSALLHIGWSDEEAREAAPWPPRP